MSRNWDCFIALFCRECNSYADVLAKHSVKLQIRMHILPIPPDIIKSLLAEDLVGVAHGESITMSVKLQHSTYRKKRRNDYTLHSTYWKNKKMIYSSLKLICKSYKSLSFHTKIVNINNNDFGLKSNMQSLCNVKCINHFPFQLKKGFSNVKTWAVFEHQNFQSWFPFIVNLKTAKFLFQYSFNY